MEYQLIQPRLLDKINLTAVERVLSNRGIMPENINHYLNTTDDDLIDPATIKNIMEGAKTLVAHIYNEDDIFCQIDSDCDGYTSSSELLNYLDRLFPSYVRKHIKYNIHPGKEHGIDLDRIPKGVKMVIVPDAGSSNLAEHRALKEQGIDVLVIDHHEADEISKDAIIINNQLCDYPTKSLSGAGMVYKFCSYLDQLLGRKDAEDLLDMAALGCVGDMMPLNDYELRHIITKGINRIINPFFKQMTKTQNFSIGRHGGLDPYAMSFYIVPQVNATIRMGTQEEKMLLFESMLNFKAYELIPSTKRGCKGQMETRVEQACRNCLNIKNRQTKARDTALELIEGLIEKENLLENKILIVRLRPEHATNKNLTGLIANQLMAKYQRPVLLLNYSDSEEYGKCWAGSGRGYDKSKFDDLRNFLIESGLVIYAAGHKNAMGVSISEKNMATFIDYVNQELANVEFTPCYKVDLIFDSYNFNGKDIIDLASLKHIWGQGVEEPLVALENVKVTKSNLVLMSPDKSPTLKVTLLNGTSIIKFKSSQEEYDDLCEQIGLGCIKMNIVGKCEKNEWGGSITPQILVEDWEIVGAEAYYF